MSKNKISKGVISQGIRTPIIQSGDNLKEIVINSVIESNDGKFDNGDVIAITEAVVAISQNNFVTHQNISDDITQKFEGMEEIVIVDPIQSRNRFMDILKAVAQTSTLTKIYIVMSYPTDEVGNRLVSDMAIMENNINPYTDVLTVEEFYNKLGEPRHPFTGKNYTFKFKFFLLFNKIGIFKVKDLIEYYEHSEHFTSSSFFF